MWTYRQATGELLYKATFSAPFVLVGTGYAGAGASKNNPADQALKDLGPLPRGKYTIGAAFTDPKLGAFAMRLTPDPANEMYGRDDFLMHADSVAHPGCASEGCIIQARSTRIAVAIHPDRELEVV